MILTMNNTALVMFAHFPRSDPPIFLRLDFTGFFASVGVTKIAQLRWRIRNAYLVAGLPRPGMSLRTGACITLIVLAAFKFLSRCAYTVRSQIAKAVIEFHLYDLSRCAYTVNLLIRCHDEFICMIWLLYLPGPILNLLTSWLDQSLTVVRFPGCFSH